MRMVRLAVAIVLTIGIAPLASAWVPQSAELTLPSSSAMPGKTAGWGSHGMAVFGGHEGLYASHLPMFHAPHDTQVVLRFHLKNKKNDVQLRDALAKKPELWTLDPQEFDLLRLAPGHALALQQLTARFVQGHFERGGKERFIAQMIVIDEVILFHRLSMAERRHTEGRYHLIGKASERFLVKEIDRRPDFDLIIALKPTIKLNRPLPAIITLPGDDLQAPTPAAWREVLHHQIGIDAQINKTLYFETEDVK
jgi:hypothetical protein